MKTYINLLFFVIFLTVITGPATAYPNHWEGKTLRSQLWKEEPIEMGWGATIQKLEVVFPVSDKDLGFTYKYNDNIKVGGFEFNRPLTVNEGSIFYDMVFDSYQTQDFDELIRFDRSVHESNENLDPDQKIPSIENSLRKCIAIVGEEPDDRFFINSRGDPARSERPPYYHDPVLIRRTTPIYLSKFMYKCVRFIYPRTKKTPFYNIANFEFGAIQTPKQQRIEKLYEDIYLQVRAAGLRRRLLGTFYPKSFLREHAKKTGLYQYILRQEKQKTKLTHDELAANYFGSYAKWLRNLEQFIATKS